MIILIVFAFLAGIVTVLSPCILPLVPVILAASAAKTRPIAIAIGFIIAFTVATLGLGALVSLLHLDPNLLRTLATVVIFAFGVVLVSPPLYQWWELRTGSLAAHTPQTGSGLLLGASLGIVWTPCVGPILASVIAAAASSNVTLGNIAITGSYALGTAISIMVIIVLLRRGTSKLSWLKSNSRKLQQGFGVLMIAAAVILATGTDRTIESYLITKFPAWGTGLTSIETTPLVQNALQENHAIGAKGGTTTGTITENTLLSDQGSAPEVTGGVGWLNSAPLTIKGLRGKVVLIDFWTYSCVNCLRTLPYLKAWYAKYASDGLVIIGVHSPEFEFEKDGGNVAKALHDFGITYPVVQDNNFTIWDAYQNQYWPAHYLIDKNGHIRYTHFGEGDYAQTETAIQDLLKEAGEAIPATTVAIPEYQNEAASPETYIGYYRLGSLASPESVQQDKDASYTTPPGIDENAMALSGTWNIHYQFATASPGASISFHFNAKSVNLVMGPTQDGTVATVTVDGAPIPVTMSGADVKNGTVTLQEDRLYNLVNLNTAEDHTITITFPAGNVQAYAFTFG